MDRRWYLFLISAAACARGGSVADSPDAPPDSPPCTEQTFYRDADGDGHGNPASPVKACQQPEGTVTSKDDCDDANAQRHPGLAEDCDAFDNDCNPATTETAVCPTSCTPVRRPPPDDLRHVYLVCNTKMTWTNARTTCAIARYKLAQIDDAAENAFLRNAGTIGFSDVEFHIGANDQPAEGVWKWEDDSQFWQGGFAGTPVGAHYVNWAVGEPSNSTANGEDCGEMKPGADGKWNDIPCDIVQPFICRR